MEKNNIKLNRNGIYSVETWVNWNGTPWPTIVIERCGETFSSEIGDPEHGGGSKSGTLQQVLEGLHPSIATQYKNLFSIKDPTPELIAGAGFEGYAII